MTPSILLVDDDPEHVEAVRRAFAAADPETRLRVARTLRATEGMVAADPPDLVLTSLVLPDGRATDLLAAQGTTPAFPILVMTSQGDERIAADVIKAGAIDYVVKSPEALAEMPRTVARALREWGVRQERTRLVDALRDSQAALRALLDGNPGQATLLDAGGTILAANLALGRSLGRAVPKLIGACLFDLLAPEVAAGRRARLEQALDSGELVRFEDAHGGRHFAHYLQPILPVDGAPARVSSLSLDISDRKLAEDALRASQEQFHDLVVNVDAIVYHVSVVDGDPLRSRITYMNPQMEAALGYRPEEFLRDPELWAGILHPEDRERVFAETTRLAARGELLHRSYRMRRKGSDEYRWLEDRLVAARDREGRLLALRGVAHDVTDRRQAEQALREQAELLRESQRVASVGHYSLDVVADVLNTSEGFDEVFGMGAEHPRDFAGWLAIVHPEDRDRLGAHYEEHVLRDRLPFDLEYRILRPRDGAERWVRGLGRLELDSDGLPQRMFGTVQDITESRRAEEALRRSERRFRALVEQGVDAVTVLALDGTILYVGPTTERLTGYPPEERVGQDGLGNVFAEDLPAVRAAFARLAAEPGHAERAEFRVVRKDGTVWWAEAAAVNLLAEPSVAGIVVNYRDVSERKRAEAERLELERRLLRAQKLESLGALAGGVAHDFNNLLTGIMGYLELAAMGLPPGSTAGQDIENAAQACRRAAELSRKMLSYSGKGRFVNQRLDLVEVVKANERLMQAALAPDTRLELRLSPGPCAVEADKDQLEQALLALVTNAAEAIGERQGVVRLSTGVIECDQRYLGSSRIDPKPAPGPFAYVEVADTGCGMDEATLERVFEPFFTTKFAGRGLGLAVVLGVVRGHQGAILVDSAPGNGTRVRVLLPAPEGAAADTQPSAQAALTRVKILVVDDEDTVREPCLQMLRRQGFDSLGASDGLQGLALLQKHGEEIACVLLDLTMAGMDGVATLLTMRRLRPGVRVILSSGYGEEEVMDRFGVERPDAFLQKPYSGEELKKTIAKVLAKS